VNSAEEVWRKCLRSAFILFFTAASLLAGSCAPVGVNSYPTSATLFLVGLLFFTLFEYVIHRFIFHGIEKEGWVRKVFPRATFNHYMHHCRPRDARYFVAPLYWEFITMAFLLAFFRVALGSWSWSAGINSGILVGGIAYDFFHYTFHFKEPRVFFLKALKHAHVTHHFVDTKARFGVTSPLWDVVFGTLKVHKRDARGQARVADDDRKAA
jgi:sterol desaturase/sphingolipid hydroxylase (fatty acid hydroxylase superfamily)